MEAVIFVGIQATGKSTFYHHQFARTHMRVNLDMLKTRHREQCFINTCLDTRQRFVVDNTNPTPIERQRYIQAAQRHDFSVIGYYFESKLAAALVRNRNRSLEQQIPEQGVKGTAARLLLPTYKEGFDQLFYVRLQPEQQFSIETWQP